MGHFSQARKFPGGRQPGWAARPGLVEGLERPGPPVTSHTVDARAYGEFLNTVFDQWVHHDVGTIHVMNFEWALASWCQLAPTACIFSPRCGKAGIVEHDGSVYSCDRTELPVRGLQEIFSPHHAGHEHHGAVAGRRAPGRRGDAATGPLSKLAGARGRGLAGHCRLLLQNSQLRFLRQRATTRDNGA